MRNEPERRGGSGEIDLFELLACMWREKILIVTMTAIMIFMAVAYALLATPIYEAKVVVQPPSQNDIAQLNYGRGGDTGLSMLKIKDVYNIYLRHLQSESLRREFFRSVYLPNLKDDERKGSQDELYSRFKEVVTLGIEAKDAPSRVFVKASWHDPQQAAEWVVRYIEMAGLRGKAEVIKDARTDAMVKASNLDQKISAARESTRRQREDEIVQLREALRIAQSIGLEKPPIISNSLSNEVSAGMGGALIYMRGSKALEADINNLRMRKSDDPFVAGLRQWQEALAFYRSLQVDPGVVEVYRQDGAVVSPDRPVKPRRVIIIAIGGLAGIAIGVLFAFLRQFKGEAFKRRTLQR